MRRSKKQALSAVVVAAGALALVAPAQASTPPVQPAGQPAGAVHADRERLTSLADKVIEAGRPGAVIARRTSSGLVPVARGKADIESGRPAQTGDRYRIGSNTKTMVAVVVLQLVEEGRLGLDDSVAELLPGFGLDPRITVRHLLMQTSGFRTNTMVFSPPRSYESNRFRYFSPGELVELALTNPEPRHEPGTRFEYANTNYVLAGMVIEAVTGNDVADELRERIFWPLGMRDTSFPERNPMIFGSHLRGYLPSGNGLAVARAPRGKEPSPWRQLSEQLRRNKTVDTTVYSMSWAWTAGGVISTVADQTTFTRGLFTGRLLSQRMLDEMMTPGPNGTYGMGIAKAAAPCVPGGVVWGHDGSVFGYQSATFSTPDGRTQTAAVGNAWVQDDQGNLDLTVIQAAVAATC